MLSLGSATSQGPYISQVTSTIGVGTLNQRQSRVEQTLDGYGNLTLVKQYDYGLAEADARTYTNTYLTDANWTSRYIRNRLKSSMLTKGGYSIELARNYYDHESRPTCGGGGSYFLQTISAGDERQHDSAVYTNTYFYRGNPVSVARPGYAGCLTYDVTGVVRGKTDNQGTTTIQTQSSTNYAVPSQITANGFTTSMKAYMSERIQPRQQIRILLPPRGFGGRSRIDLSQRRIRRHCRRRNRLWTEYVYAQLGV